MPLKRRKNNRISGIFILLLVLQCSFLSGCGSRDGADESSLSSAPQSLPAAMSAPCEDTITADELIGYFNETVLEAEYPGTAGEGVVRKWTRPFTYYTDGDWPQPCLDAIDSTVELLNSISGFPGISQADSEDTADMLIRLCGNDEFYSLMGDYIKNEDADGAGVIRFNSSDNEILKALICVRSDTDGAKLPGVVTEEIINCIGLGNDTRLRSDSLLYEYADNDRLSETDIQIITMLYAPEIRCGMNAAECAQIINGLISQG